MHEFRLTSFLLTVKLTALKMVSKIEEKATDILFNLLKMSIFLLFIDNAKNKNVECVFGNLTLHLGDILLSEDPCEECICSTRI